MAGLLEAEVRADIEAMRLLMWSGYGEGWCCEVEMDR